MRQNGHLIIETIPSQVLRDNPLADPFERKVPVYLPPGYDESETRYPVVYLLTGFTGRGTLLINDATFEENIQERLDRLIGSGQVQPLIVVMPDCFTRYGGSQYLNSSATGRYEDHLIDELVPFIDEHYRSRAEAGYRAVAGKSSGGYGALVQGMRHPEVFGAVACHSGDMYFDYAYKPDFIKFLDATTRHNITSYETLYYFLNGFSPKMHPKPANFFDLIHIAAMAACYSPNPASPTGFDLPFEFHTGKLRPAVWQRWLDQDPVTMLENEAHLTALRRLKLLYLDCGNRDEYALHYGARIFSQRLAGFDIPYVHEEFDGGHRSTSFRYDVSLKAISEAFGESQSG
jgi:enterochelin esterase family protein